MSEAAGLLNPVDLEGALAKWAGNDSTRQAIAMTVTALSHACTELSSLISRGVLAGPLAAVTGRRSGVDPQKELDVIANDLIVDAIRAAPVAAILSEEMDDALTLANDAPLLIAVDPIDGSSNADVNAPIGTIFSLLPAAAGASAKSPNHQFLQSGVHQVAAGLFVYGPQTSMALTLGEGTDIYTLDRAEKCFIRTHAGLEIPSRTAEYAINSSNFRFWDQPIRTYFNDCNRGEDGPRGKNFNMRWTASPVADFYRILMRGGIFLYPGDLRPAYRNGRLRLLYEGNPVAFLIEQAGGAASNGQQRLLELQPEGIHQHVPVIAGSRDEVRYVMRLYLEPHADGERSPLFRRRGLFWN